MAAVPSEPPPLLRDAAQYEHAASGSAAQAKATLQVRAVVGGPRSAAAGGWR